MTETQQNAQVQEAPRRIGILTGGGDTSSLNAILWGAQKECWDRNYDLIGFTHGWRGLLTKSTQEVSVSVVESYSGGTLLRTSRTKLSREILPRAILNLEQSVDALIAIGGDDTLTVGKQLSIRTELPIVMIAKTIDNDVGTNPGDNLDFTQMANYFVSGFPSAAARVQQYTKDLRSTAYSHERIIFLETMGRSPGWLALSSYQSNPDFILIPEVPLDLAHFLEKVEERYQSEKNVVVVVAEGLSYKGRSHPIAESFWNRDVFGHRKLGGVAEMLAKKVRKKLHIQNANAVNPSYLYRSGPPSFMDHEIGIELGKAAVRALYEKKSGVLIAPQRNEIWYTGPVIKTQVLPIECIPVDSRAKIIPRCVDPRFYDGENYSITKEGREYFKPLEKNHR